MFAPLAAVCGLVFFFVLLRSLLICCRYPVVREAPLLATLYLVLCLSLFCDLTLFALLSFGRTYRVLDIVDDCLMFGEVFLFLARLVGTVAELGFGSRLMKAIYCGCWMALAAILLSYIAVWFLGYSGIGELVLAGTALFAFVFVAGTFLALSSVTRQLCNKSLPAYDGLLFAFFVCKMCSLLGSSLFYASRSYSSTDWAESALGFAACQYAMEICDQLVPAVLIFAMISRGLAAAKDNKVSFISQPDDEGCVSV